MRLLRKTGIILSLSAIWMFGPGVAFEAGAMESGPRMGATMVIAQAPTGQSGDQAGAQPPGTRPDAQSSPRTGPQPTGKPYPPGAPQVGVQPGTQPGGPATGGNTAFTQRTVVIQITDSLQFAPPLVTINVGDTAKWVNKSRLQHTVTCDPKQAKYPTHVILPANAQPFDSGFLMPGDVFTHTFQAPGTYRYICTTHESARMIGEVMVNPAGGGK